MCSGSADSTLKVWNTKTRKIMLDLPGHADEVSGGYGGGSGGHGEGVRH